MLGPGVWGIVMPKVPCEKFIFLNTLVGKARVTPNFNRFSARLGE
jgi:hypothetical protein